MFRFFKSVRTRLTVWYAFVLLSTLVGFGLIAYTYLREQLSDNLDKSLTNEVRWVKAYIETRASKVKPSRRFGVRKKTSPPAQAQPQQTAPAQPPVAQQPAPGTVTQQPLAVPQTGDQAVAEPTDADDEIWNQIYEHELLNPKRTMIEATDKSGAILFRSFTVGEESLMVGHVPVDSIKLATIKNDQAMDLRVAATATKNIHLYVAYPLAELTDALDNLFSVFLVLIPIALAVSIGGGWLLAYVSLRPVDLITRTAREISAHNLDTRIPPRAVDDEIGRLIRTFNDMIERLHHSFDQIKQFSVDASHELRTPLTIMRGEVELALRSTKSPEEYRSILVSNLEEILRLASIIDSLLTLSKADANRPPEIAVERLNMYDLVEELYEDTEVIAMKKNISVVLAKNDRLEILGDKIRLRQLFLNLLDNAVKYTPDRGKVTLASEGINGWVKVSVKDTGIGIPSEEREKIFDRFYRVDKGRSREMGGSGLGLSIAQWIAGLHRGRIEVDSSPGQGSTFSVYLPR